MLEKISDANFEEKVLNQSGLVVVDIYADWCGPCRLLAPTLEKLSVKYTNKVKFYKLDADTNPVTPGNYRVKGIPNLLIFKNGELVDQLTGNQPFDVIESSILKNS